MVGGSVLRLPVMNLGCVGVCVCVAPLGHSDFIDRKHVHGKR